MMLQFILYMIFIYIAAKIIGQLLRTIRRLMTPNRDIRHRNMPSTGRRGKSVEDIPYEEVKDQ